MRSKHTSRTRGGCNIAVVCLVLNDHGRYSSVFFKLYITWGRSTARRGVSRGCTFSREHTTTAVLPPSVALAIGEAV